MQKLISKYGLAVHLAIVTVATLCFPLSVVLWLSAMGAVWLVMEPSRIRNETLHEAHRRVVRAFASDPLFWVLLTLVAVSVLRFFNTGISLTYDAEAGRWLFSEAIFPLLPASVEGAGEKFIGCSVAAFVVVLGCRHCLGRSARSAFTLSASTLSGILGLLQAWWIYEGSASLLEEANCSLAQPAYVGCAYGIFLVCAVVALAAAFESHWLKAMPLTIIGIGGNLLGLFTFAPAAVAAAHAAVALVVLVYAVVYLRIRVAKTTECKCLVLFGFGCVLAALAAIGLLPESFVESRTSPYLTGAFVPEGFLSVRTALSDLCARVWKASPWLGNGLGSFLMDLRFTATSADWEVISPLQRGVPNGYWLLLVERGVVGAFLLAVPAILLFGTYLIRLVLGVRRMLPQPLSWAGFLLLVVAILETLVDCSYLLPGPLLALAAVLALSASAIPKEMKSNG